MANPPIPADINAAEPALRSEFIDYIEQLIDAAEVRTSPTGGNDLLKGNGNNNTINGQDGNDVIYAYGGNDTLRGGSGNDYILGQVGDDVIDGDSGNDYLFGQLGVDDMDGGDGDDAMFGGSGNDTLDGEDGNDWIYGNNDNDTLNGGAGNDIIDGGYGIDVLNGGADNDELSGGNGTDTINGSTGNDFIEGGAGVDTLSGGEDDDVYYYANPLHGRDRILDFDTDKDSFQFLGSAFGVEAGTDLDDGTTFITGNAPVSVTGDATVLYETDSGRLWFDADGTGSGAAVLIARITGAPTVTNDDIIFV